MTPPSSHLRAVDAGSSLAPTLAERISALQSEARNLVREHMEAFDASMRETQRLAAEITGGGEAYPAGVRDVARQLAERIEADLNTVSVISMRA